MRFLFTTNPLVGHWFPMIPLARAVRAAGHDVVVAAGPDLVPDVERRGFTAWPIGNDLASIQAAVRTRSRPDGESEVDRLVADGMAMFAVPAIGRARDLLARTADRPPDVVVSEIYELGGGWVPAGLHVWHGLGAHYPNFVQLAQLCEGRIRAELGDPARPSPIAATPYLDPFPAQLQPPDDNPWSDMIAMRPAAGDLAADDELPASLAVLPHDRTVYLTLGTLFNSAADFAVPLQALGGLDVNVVATTGRGLDPGELGKLPANVVAEQFVPQSLLLPSCDAVVCHAGAGTIIGALAYGVPLVCLPRGADQFGNAEAVQRVGAGLMLPPEAATAEGIRRAVGRVLADHTFRSAAGDLQTVIEALPEPTAVLAELVARLGPTD